MKNYLSFFSKKIVVCGTVIILGAAVAVFVFFKNGGAKEETLIVHPNDFLQQVSVSGKVVAAESLDLSFEQSGRVTSVQVKVGDKVSTGQLLASQDTTQLDAQLAEMQANIDVQKAKLDQILAGASLEDITVSETAVSNAEVSVANAQQAVADAKQNLIDKLRDANTKADDAVRYKADQLFSGPQTNNPQLIFRVSDPSLENDIESNRLVIEYNIFIPWKSLLDRITNSSDLSEYINTTRKYLNDIKIFLDKLALALNDPNSSYVVGSTPQAIPANWKSDLSTARTNINTAISNISAAQENLETRTADLKTAEGSLKNAQDQLLLKKAPARSPDIAVYKAQIRQAEASMQNIVAELSKRKISSPISGIVTVINSKVGSIAAADETVISIISMDMLEIESYVPEKNISLIKIGDQAALTLDAYGSDVPFTAKVILIDPAETIRDGISTYRVKLQVLDHDERIKSGMTASIIITTEEKPNVIVVPQGIVANKAGKKFIKVKEDKNIIDREIETGSVSSLGQIEVISGLKDGDIVILEQAKK